LYTLAGKERVPGTQGIRTKRGENAKSGAPDNPQKMNQEGESSSQQKQPPSGKKMPAGALRRPLPVKGRGKKTT